MTEDLTLTEISTDVISSINTNFSQVEDAVNTKAYKNGDCTKVFNVADATEATQAVNKGQLDGSVSTINTTISELETRIDAQLATKVDVSDTTVTKQGNTFNGANQLIQLNSSGQLPALDGSLLIGIAGGLLPINSLGAITSNFTLDINKIDTASVNANVALSFPTTGLINGVENKCILDFTLGSSGSLTYPGTVVWVNGVVPTLSATSGLRNRLTFTTIDDGTTWAGSHTIIGRVLLDWTQPTLSSNGTLGGYSFAVSASNEYRPAWYAVNKNNSDYWTTTGGTSPVVDFIFYNPVALQVNSLSFTNRSDSGNSAPANFDFYGSNDNSVYTLIGSYTNTVSTGGDTWSKTINSSNLYKYHKIHVTSTFGPSDVNIAELAISAKYMQT